MIVRFRHVVVTALCLGVAGYSLWVLMQEDENILAGAPNKRCDGEPLGAIRINEDGSPQICLKR